MFDIMKKSLAATINHDSTWRERNVPINSAYVKKSEGNVVLGVRICEAECE
jgi:hypothetical protein